MPGEDRERTFEKALASHLRASPAAGRNTAHRGCPDPEVLAAYHERMLAPERMASWKEHIATCLRCQEILALLEASDELAIGVTEENEAEKVLPMVANSEPHGGASVRATSPALPARATTDRTITVSRETPQPRRLTHWRWLAPAGAIAAGLLAWIAIRPTIGPEFELAKNQASRAVNPATAQPAEPAPALQKQDEINAPKSADSNSSSSPRYESRRAASANKPVSRDNLRAALNPGALGPPEEKAKTDLDNGRLAHHSAAPSSRERSEQKAVPLDELTDRKDAGEFANRVPSAPPLVPSPAPASGAAGLGGMIAGGREPTKSARDQALDDAKKEAPAASAESVEGEGGTQAINKTVRTTALPQMMRLTRGQSSAVISAPGGKAIWRAGAAGIVAHSTNSGSIWKLQRTGVIADLIAGSAPSEEVCWIVGRTGTILRTTDGGAHWMKIHGPVEDDFAAIFAADAQQATVSTAATHKAYRTMDGGLTWTPLTNP